MTENEFGDVLVGLMLRMLNFFPAHQTSMANYSNSSWPGHGFFRWSHEFQHNGLTYTLQVNTNMVKKQNGQRDFKVLNVWLWEKLPGNWRTGYYSAPSSYLVWLQDDVEFGFDYRDNVAADRRDEIAELITNVIFPGLLELEPALVLQMMADL